MQVTKAIALSDAKIQFVSLVDKAANKKQFLITKAENGNAQFSTYGRILKVDDNAHYVTGIVYEPMVEDAHGNYMTEGEIVKAAYWFAKNGDQVDVQHSFEAAEGVAVVESYVAPCDMEINSTPIMKGTWVMTAEITNANLWRAVQKGKITGFSMGGVGKYSEEDVDLRDVNKSDESALQGPATPEKVGVFKKLAAMFGFDVVEKGEVAERYEESAKNSSFWNAWYALEETLRRYNWQTDHYEFITDEAVIREALTEFSGIITDVLSMPNVVKALGAEPISKAGKKISSANRNKLDTAYEALTELRAALDEEVDGDNIEKEDTTMNKEEIQAMIDSSINAAVEKAMAAQAAETEPTETPPAEEGAQETLTGESVQKMIDESIEKALTTLQQPRALPSNLNGATQQVEKANGLFDGLFV